MGVEAVGGVSRVRRAAGEEKFLRGKKEIERNREIAEGSTGSREGGRGACHDPVRQDSC